MPALRRIAPVKIVCTRSLLSTHQHRAKDTSNASTWNLTIDDTGAGDRQVITGFGAAITDSTVKSFNTLTTDVLDDLLQELSHFSLIRHTIGSSDPSADPAYTYDDNGCIPDESLEAFSLEDRERL